MCGETWMAFALNLDVTRSDESKHTERRLHQGMQVESDTRSSSFAQPLFFQKDTGSQPGGCIAGSYVGRPSGHVNGDRDL